MKTKTKPLNILAPLLIGYLISLGIKPINAQEVEDERAFDYAAKSEKGPSKWGEIKKEWSACNSGTMQSPIDLAHERVRIISKPENRNYKACNATVTNRGHDIQIKWVGDAGSILVNGTNYPLLSAHWHSPSEHTLRGRRYEMELHLVHLSTGPNVKYKIAVVGVLYKIGKPDKFLSKIPATT
ncbi:alpha carbonic anhydrase 2 [Phtheirospermum japonicum]|uniref:Carbonic anhydrase n=1 Tax=Phtheirospermum japonicum TaxID=374723 RepID=A0A830D311_9LAMI|nr:alpha carbonic anhydrase 2 [Phtheirospermum japonicum]